MDCLFCKIIKGLVPAKTLYEDAVVKVIMDITPDSNGHCLVIPKKHITDFEELEHDTLAHINDIAKKMKNYLFEALTPDGLHLHVNYGIAQVIKHYHLHLIPVYEKPQEIKNLDIIYEQIKKVID